MGEVSFVGLQNYIDIFTSNTDYASGIFNTLKFTVISNIVKIIPALFLAIMLQEGIRGKNVYRTILYLPSILPFMIIGLTFRSNKEPLLPKNENRPGYGSVLLRQGITSVVTGNCGISMYPLNPDSSAADQMRSYYAPVLGDIAPFKKIVN